MRDVEDAVPYKGGLETIASPVSLLFPRRREAGGWRAGDEFASCTGRDVEDAVPYEGGLESVRGAKAVTKRGHFVAKRTNVPVAEFEPHDLAQFAKKRGNIFSDEGLQFERKAFIMDSSGGKCIEIPSKWSKVEVFNVFHRVFNQASGSVGEKSADRLR